MRVKGEAEGEGKEIVGEDVWRLHGQLRRRGAYLWQTEEFQIRTTVPNPHDQAGKGIQQRGDCREPLWRRGGGGPQREPQQYDIPSANKVFL